jgi:predicted lipoprotein with Yx(FWY)xxD motif
VPLVAVTGALGVLIAGCGGGPSPNSKPAPPSLGGSTTTVGVGGSQYGRVLMDAKGATLYLFSGDEAGKSTCTGRCAQTWQPYIAHGTPHAADATQPAIEEGFLGTITRPDGKPQVAYKGHPLYYYSGDKHAGAVTGEGKSQFGGKWYLLEGSGNKVSP